MAPFHGCFNALVGNHRYNPEGHQNSEFKEELIPFIFYALLFASVFSLVFSFVFKGKADTKRCDVYKNKTALFLILADGAIVGVLNFVNLKLAGTIPAVIHFPVYNVASMMLTAVAGRLFFGERIGARKLIGFGIGLIAITIIGLL